MGCYTDQGFVERLKVYICQAMILLTCATIPKIFVLARFVGVNPRERNGLWFSWFFAKICWVFGS